MRIIEGRAYLDIGDEVELYDERGLSVGLTCDVVDVHAVTFWPTTEFRASGYRVVGRDGHSMIGHFDLPTDVRPGMFITFEPVMRLPQPPPPSYREGQWV